MTPKITLIEPAPAEPSARARWVRAARDNLLAEREKRRERLQWRETAIRPVVPDTPQSSSMVCSRPV